MALNKLTIEMVDSIVCIERKKVFFQSICFYWERSITPPSRVHFKIDQMPPLQGQLSLSLKPNGDTIKIESNVIKGREEKTLTKQTKSLSYTQQFKLQQGINLKKDPSHILPGLPKKRGDLLSRLMQEGQKPSSQR